MASQPHSSKTTTDHQEIRKWVEKHGGHPACVRGTGSPADPGLLRIDYPGYGGEESLAPIDWNEFFDKFEEKKLAFIYDTDQKSRFSKLVRRDQM